MRPVHTDPIIRNQKEIDTVINRCADNDGVSEYPGMTYEQGVLAMYRWLTEDDADPVFD